MAQDELHVDVTTINGGETLLLTLRGSLDLLSSEKVRKALIAATDEGKHEIVVDLRQVDFLDSTGLGALIGAHRRATEAGGKVCLTISNGPIARLLNITGLIRVFPVYDSVEAAISAP